MSRLGRDYLQVGMYTEMLFPNNDIRFIAINNGIDSINGAENDLTPFINIFNEYYAKDTSRKIRAVVRAKGESGKPTAVSPPYGYLKSKEDKNKWVVDEETARVVKLIFELCVKGYGPSQIANELYKRKINSPVAHKEKLGLKSPSSTTKNTEPHYWNTPTVSSILKRQEYLGHTVNFRTSRKSFKNRRKIYNPKEKWAIFENTHEPIIDQETFDIVQKIRENHRTRESMGKMPILSGMIYCADCGARLYQVCSREWTHDKEYLACSSYRKKGNKTCSSHKIKNVVLEQMILAKIQAINSMLGESEETFLKLATKKSKEKANKNLRDAKREYETSKTRYDKIDILIQNLYEDNVEGKISDERFEKLSMSYEKEQYTLKDRMLELEKRITHITEDMINVNLFMKTIRKYTNATELTSEMVRELISKVLVHETQTLENGKKTQTIDIYFNNLDGILLST